MLKHGEIKTDVYMEEACCIPKGWGKEIIIENNELYCGKILVFNKGCKFSMHYHMNKDETWWVEEGEFNYTFIDTETAYPTTIPFSKVDSLSNLAPLRTYKEVVAVPDTSN